MLREKSYFIFSSKISVGSFCLGKMLFLKSCLQKAKQSHVINMLIYLGIPDFTLPRLMTCIKVSSAFIKIGRE